MRLINEYMDRINALILVLKNNGVIDDNDKDYIFGNISMSEWERRQKNE